MKKIISLIICCIQICVCSITIGYAETNINKVKIPAQLVHFGARLRDEVSVGGKQYIRVSINNVNGLMDANTHEIHFSSLESTFKLSDNLLAIVYVFEERIEIYNIVTNSHIGTFKNLTQTFSDNGGYVQKSTDGKWYFMDKDGNISNNGILSDEYDILVGYGNNFCYGKHGSSNHQWRYISIGVVDKNGNIISDAYPEHDYEQEINPNIYDGVLQFNYWNELAALNMENGRYIDLSSYDEHGRFYEGLVEVELDGKYGFADKNGDLVINCIYDYANNFSDGLAAVELNGKIGFINKSGEIVIDFLYDYANNFSDGVAVVKQAGKYGVIDKQGNVIIPFVYDDMDTFHKNKVFGVGEYAGETRNDTVGLQSVYDSYVDQNNNELTQQEALKIMYSSQKYIPVYGEYWASGSKMVYLNDLDEVLYADDNTEYYVFGEQSQYLYAKIGDDWYHLYPEKVLNNFENITFPNKTYTYDGTEKSILISGQLPEGATVTYTNEKGTNSGTYNATAVIEATGYNTLTLNATMKIEPASISVKADDKTIIKDGDMPELTYTIISGQLFGTDSISGKLSSDADGSVVGTFDINKGTLTVSPNYNLNFTKGILTVTDKTPQNIIVADIPYKTYGDAAFNLSVTPDSTSNLSSFAFDSSNKNVATVNETGIITIIGAGETIISVTEPGNKNYAAVTVTKKLTVAKKALEIKVDNVNITYGDIINPKITYTGFIDGESETDLTKAVEIKGYTLIPDVGEYDIILSGAEAANYEISYINAKLIVNKKDVTVTQLKVFDKVVDTTTDAAINTSSLMIDGMILGDDVTIDFTKAIAVFATSEVGTDINVTITGLELVGTHAENYRLTNTEIATTASIKETITASDIAAQIAAVTVVQDSKEITLPNVPVGYKITVKSSDNEAVVQADGNIAPVETDTQVGLIFTVTNETDETDVADTAVINVTIPASTKINVTVTAEENGTVTGGGKYLKNSDVTVVATPDSGYKFRGWYIGETSVSTSTTYTFKADNDVALKAKFDRISNRGGGSLSSSYVVKFETNGGSMVTSQSLKKNTVVKEPTVPTKEGYTFEGWYTDEELTVAYDFSIEVTKGFTLYAKWTEVQTDIEKPDDIEKSDVSSSFLFEDVKSDDWFYDSVKYVNENSLMNGVSENKFAPNTTLTRTMLVTVLYRNEGEPVVESNATFNDVVTGAYYEKAVAWAQDNGIVNGYSETEFAPDANITREQIAAIMHRYAEYKGYDTSIGENANIISYSDYDEISEYAISSVQYAVSIGLIKGKSASTINPKDNVTRAEIATILQRFIENNK